MTPLTKKLFSGSLILTAGEAINQVCSLVRNVVLARILTKADFGTAALLGMVVTIFEIGGRLSIENCVVQSKDGNQPRFMAAAHLVQSLPGIVSAALIFGTAGPMAHFFGVPEAAWGLRALAILPVLRSLSHLDVYRMTRTMRFGPGVIVDTVPQVVITVLAWPLASIWPGYAVLVWLLIGKQLASTLAAHFMAESPYRWCFDRRAISEILKFGWPLLINGFLIFAVMQGDRFAVGVRYTVSELAVYAVAGSLALLPANTLLKLSGYMMLPLMSSVQDDLRRFRQRVSSAAEIYSLLSGVYAMILILAGGPLVALIFGPKYREAAALTAWLGLAQALRLLRGVPTTSAVARGDTRNVMFSNACRISGVVLSFAAAYAGGSLALIAASAAIGEAVALIASFWRFSNTHRVPATDYLSPVLVAAAFTSLSFVLSWLGLSDRRDWVPLATAALLCLAFVAVYLTLFDESCRLIFSILPPLSVLRKRTSAGEGSLSGPEVPALKGDAFETRSASVGED